MTKESEFTKELASLLNRYGVDTKLGTPDFILAEAMIDSLQVVDHFNCRREAWFGRVPPKDTLAEKLGMMVELLEDKK